MTPLPPVIDCHAHTDRAHLADEARGLRRRLERCRQYNVRGVVFSVPFRDARLELPIEPVAVVAEQVGVAVGISFSIEPPSQVDELPGLEQRLQRAEALARSLAAERRIVAIGEAGLDYYWPLADHLEAQGVTKPEAIGRAVRDDRQRLLVEPDVQACLAAQKRVFGQAIRWAVELDLPLVVHERDAGRDATDLIEAGDLPPERVMLHCYSGTPEEAVELAGRGYRLSLPASIVSREPYRAIARAVDLESLVLETDSPYHSPVLGLWHQTAEPASAAAEQTDLTGNARQRWVSRQRKRLLAQAVGERFPELTFHVVEDGRLRSVPAGEYYARPDRRRTNEPFLVRCAADEIAHLKGVDPATVCEATTANAKALFSPF